MTLYKRKDTQKTINLKNTLNYQKTFLEKIQNIELTLKEQNFQEDVKNLLMIMKILMMKNLFKINGNKIKRKSNRQFSEISSF
jgi:hypothetical protein